MVRDGSHNFLPAFSGEMVSASLHHFCWSQCLKTLSSFDGCENFAAHPGTAFTSEKPYWPLSAFHHPINSLLIFVADCHLAFLQYLLPTLLRFLHWILVVHAYAGCVK